MSYVSITSHIGSQKSEASFKLKFIYRFKESWVIRWRPHKHYVLLTCFILVTIINSSYIMYHVYCWYCILFDYIYNIKALNDSVVLLYESNASCFQIQGNWETRNHITKRQTKLTWVLSRRWRAKVCNFTVLSHTLIVFVCPAIENTTETEQIIVTGWVYIKDWV